MFPTNPSSPPSSLSAGAGSLPEAGLQPLSVRDAAELAVRGYVLRAPLLSPELAAALPAEIDRLIAEGAFDAPPDRIVAGQPTEWILQLGAAWGRRPEPITGARSPLIGRLWTALQDLGRSYNAARSGLIAAGVATAASVPPVAPDGMELVVNRVVGTRAAAWSGLPLHTDDSRFNAALRALHEGSVRHDQVRGRALTVSGYARALAPSGERMNDLGGALPFVVRPEARNPGDAAVFDIVPAHHNTGVVFFPRTIHGVGRMPAGSVRYSFQAFYPSHAAWQAIAQRIAAGELEHELAAALVREVA